jgi:hypothetical protein
MVHPAWPPRLELPSTFEKVVDLDIDAPEQLTKGNHR